MLILPERRAEKRLGELLSIALPTTIPLSNAIFSDVFTPFLRIEWRDERCIDLFEWRCFFDFSIPQNPISSLKVDI